MQKLILSLFSCITLLCPIFASADSLPIKNGRYNGGPVLIMQLTKVQIDLLKKHYEPFKEIKLSKDQQKLISKDMGTKNPPTKIIVALPEDTTKDCTCALRNIGVIISETTIELPKEYIVSDAEAEAAKITD